MLVPELDPFFRFPFFELLDRLVVSIPHFPVQHPIMLPSAVALTCLKFFDLALEDDQDFHFAKKSLSFSSGRTSVIAILVLGIF